MHPDDWPPDERDRFQSAIRRMRKSFELVADQLERAGWDVTKATEDFNDGCEGVCSVFADVLLQRDTRGGTSG